MDHLFILNNMPVRVMLDQKQENVHAIVNGERLMLSVQQMSSHALVLTDKNGTRKLYTARDKNNVYISIEGRSLVFCLPVQDSDSVKPNGCQDHGSDLVITAPMPGAVLKLNVQTGDPISEGDCLAVLEAMKMETGLHASRKAVVKKIHIVQGQQVKAGDLLIELEASDV